MASSAAARAAATADPNFVNFTPNQQPQPANVSSSPTGAREIHAAACRLYMEHHPAQGGPTELVDLVHKAGRLLQDQKTLSEHDQGRCVRGERDDNDDKDDLLATRPAPHPKPSENLRARIEHLQQHGSRTAADAGPTPNPHSGQAEDCIAAIRQLQPAPPPPQRSLPSLQQRKQQMLATMRRTNASALSSTLEHLGGSSPLPALLTAATRSEICEISSSTNPDVDFSCPPLPKAPKLPPLPWAHIVCKADELRDTITVARRKPPRVLALTPLGSPGERGRFQAIARLARRRPRLPTSTPPISEKLPPVPLHSPSLDRRQPRSVDSSDPDSDSDPDSSAPISAAAAAAAATSSSPASSPTSSCQSCHLRLRSIVRPAQTCFACKRLFCKSCIHDCALQMIPTTVPGSAAGVYSVCSDCETHDHELELEVLEMHALWRPNHAETDAVIRRANWLAERVSPAKATSWRKLLADIAVGASKLAAIQPCSAQNLQSAVFSLPRLDGNLAARLLANMLENWPALDAHPPSPLACTLVHHLANKLGQYLSSTVDSIPLQVLLTHRQLSTILAVVERAIHLVSTAQSHAELAAALALSVADERSLWLPYLAHPHSRAEILAWQVLGVAADSIEAALQPCDRSIQTEPLGSTLLLLLQRLLRLPAPHWPAPTDSRFSSAVHAVVALLRRDTATLRQLLCEDPTCPYILICCRAAAQPQAWALPPRSQLALMSQVEAHKAALFLLLSKASMTDAVRAIQLLAADMLVRGAALSAAMLLAVVVSLQPAEVASASTDDLQQTATAWRKVAADLLEANHAEACALALTQHPDGANLLVQTSATLPSMPLRMLMLAHAFRACSLDSPQSEEVAVEACLALVDRELSPKPAQALASACAALVLRYNQRASASAATQGAPAPEYARLLLVVARHLDAAGDHGAASAAYAQVAPWDASCETRRRELEAEAERCIDEELCARQQAAVDKVSNAVAATDFPMLQQLFLKAQSVEMLEAMHKLLAEPAHEQLLQHQHPAVAKDPSRRRLLAALLVLRAAIETQCDARPLTAAETLAEALIMWPHDPTLALLLHSAPVQWAVADDLIVRLEPLAGPALEPASDYSEGDFPDLQPAGAVHFQHLLAITPSIEHRALRRGEEAMLLQLRDGRTTPLEVGLQYVDLCEAADSLLSLLPCKRQAARYFVQAMFAVADHNGDDAALRLALGRTALEVALEAFILALLLCSPGEQMAASLFLLDVARATGALDSPQAHPQLGDLVEQVLVSLPRLLSLAPAAPLLLGRPRLACDALPVCLAAGESLGEALCAIAAQSGGDGCERGERPRWLLPNIEPTVASIHLMEGEWKRWFQGQGGFAGAREQCMARLLADSGLGVEPIERALGWPVIQRTADGWLRSDGVPALQLHGPCFSAVTGFDVNCETGEFKLHLVPARDALTSLFTWRDIHDILGGGWQAAFLSLDKPQTEHAHHPFQSLSFAPDAMAGSDVLMTMLHADYLLKMLSMGVEVSASAPFALRPAMAGFLKRLPPSLQHTVRSVAARRAEQRGGGDGSSSSSWSVPFGSAARFRIASGGVVSCEQERGRFLTVEIGNPDMCVLAQQQPEGGEEDGERAAHTAIDLDLDSNRPELQFASDMTAAYDTLCLYFPVLARLRELAKLLAISRWVQQRLATQLDPSRIEESVDQAALEQQLHDRRRALVDKGWPYTSQTDTHLNEMLARNALDRSEMPEGRLSQMRAELYNQLQRAEQMERDTQVGELAALGHTSGRRLRPLVDEWLDHGHAAVLASVLAPSMAAHATAEARRRVQVAHRRLAADGIRPFDPRRGSTGQETALWVPAAFYDPAMLGAFPELGDDRALASVTPAYGSVAAASQLIGADEGGDGDCGSQPPSPRREAQSRALYERTIRDLSSGEGEEGSASPTALLRGVVGTDVNISRSWVRAKGSAASVDIRSPRAASGSGLGSTDGGAAVFRYILDPAGNLRHQPLAESP